MRQKVPKNGVIKLRCSPCLTVDWNDSIRPKNYGGVRKKRTSATPIGHLENYKKVRACASPTKQGILARRTQRPRISSKPVTRFSTTTPPPPRWGPPHLLPTTTQTKGREKKKILQTKKISKKKNKKKFTIRIRFNELGITNMAITIPVITITAITSLVVTSLLPTKVKFHFHLRLERFFLRPYKILPDVPDNECLEC